MTDVEFWKVILDFLTPEGFKVIAALLFVYFCLKILFPWCKLCLNLARRRWFGSPKRRLKK